jgi:hypothetical protein
LAGLAPFCFCASGARGFQPVTFRISAE